MTDLVEMTRGEDETAIVRSEWVEEWKAMGWSVLGGNAALDLTREGIAEMDKAEVVELLEAHGADPDKRTGVEKLREQLIELVFVGD